MTDEPEASLDLLRSCFFDDAGSLRLQLRGLDEAARKHHFSQLKMAIQTLRKACRYSEGSYVVSQQNFHGTAMSAQRPSLHRVEELWHEVSSHLTSLESWQASTGVSFYAAANAADFYLRLQMLQVGLAPRNQISSGFRYARRGLPYVSDHGVSGSWVLNLGGVLLDRPVPWALEALLKLCSRIAELPHPVGFAALMLELLDKHPDWEPAFNSSLGQSMLLDGFRDELMVRYPARMLLAGLSPEAGPVTEALLGALHDGSLATRLRMPDLPRSELLPLVLRRLQSSDKPTQASLWLKLYEQLAATEAEKASLRHCWLDLLTANGSQALQLAARELKPALNSGQLDPHFEIMLSGSLQGLRHEVQAAARAAWELFRALYSHFSHRQTQILIGLAPALLALRHARLRLQILRWLKDQILPDNLIQALNELLKRPELAYLEREVLLQLVPVTDTSDTTLAQNEDQRRAQPWQRRYQQLLSKVKRLDQIPVQDPGWESALQDPVFKPFKSHSEVAEGLCRAVAEGVSPLELERLMAGVLAWPVTAAQRIELRRSLRPVLAVLKGWQQPIVEESLYLLPQRSLHAVILAYGWLHPGQRPELHESSASHRAVQLGSPLGYCLLQLVELTLSYARLGRRSLLSAPDYDTGWIRPETLAARLLEHLHAKRADGPESEDLGLALLRVAPWGREALWTQIAAAVPKLTQPFQRAALELAFGPEPAVALVAFSAYNSRNPPDDWILQIRYYSAQPRDTEPNRVFRLLNRAVLARTGLSNAFYALPALLRLRQDQLMLNGGLDHSAWNRTISEMMEGIKHMLTGTPSEALPEDLASPEPRQKMMRLGKTIAGPDVLQAFWHPGAKQVNPFDSDPSMRHLLEPHPLPYPQMAGHVIEWLGPMYQPGYGFAFEPDELVAPLTIYMPMLTRRLWRAAVETLNQLGPQTRLEKHLFACALIALGERPYVPVSQADLEAIAILAGSRHASQRQNLLHLLWAVLRDGRVTPLQLAEFWASRFAGPSEGFKYLLDTASQFAASSSVARQILDLALERLWVDGRHPESRSLSRLLDFWLSLNTHASCQVSLPAARHALEAIAAKKSASQPKAALLLTLTGPSPEAALLAALRNGG